MMFDVFVFVSLVGNCNQLNGNCIEAYDRRDKPSVLVTSPSSPDRIASGTSGSGARYSNRITSTGPIVDDSNVGGRIQIKIGFESSTLQLILTVICAAGLTYRANGATRNPYVKVNTIIKWDNILTNQKYFVK